ncbi:hypothetical protein BDZ91DRAFT_750202, partial [Kalaharituber pfeilii]
MGQSGGGGDLRLDAGWDDGICCGGDSGRGCQRSEASRVRFKRRWMLPDFRTKPCALVRSGVLLSPVMENKDSIEGPCLSPSWG